MKQAEDGAYCIRALGEQDASRVANFHGLIDEVKVLGDERPVHVSRDAQGLHLKTEIRSDMPIVFKIKIG